MSSRYSLIRLKSLSWRRLILLFEATICLGLARGMVLHLAFKRIAPWLGQQNAETSFSGSAAQQESVTEVRWAIRTLSRRTPWKSNCLAQAIAAKLMLRRRAVSSTIYLGVSKDGLRLEAHAWLRAGSTIVTGDEARLQFTTVASFGAR